MVTQHLWSLVASPQLLTFSRIPSVLQRVKNRHQRGTLLSLFFKAWTGSTSFQGLWLSGVGQMMFLSPSCKVLEPRLLLPPLLLLHRPPSHAGKKCAFFLFRAGNLEQEAQNGEQ